MMNESKDFMNLYISVFILPSHFFKERGGAICPTVFFLFFVFCMLGPHLQHMESPRLGVESERQLLAYGLGHSHSNWAASTVYTTTHGKVGSLTHWVMPGKPVSLWILVKFISFVPQWELLTEAFFYFVFSCSVDNKITIIVMGNLDFF